MTTFSPQSSKIRLQKMPAWTELRVKLHHEMESGHRKDATGKTIGAWHITRCTIWLNQQIIWRGNFGGGVAKNPFMELRLPLLNTGDQITVEWTDTQGKTQRDSMSAT
jgi:sulfur-oxidizing protein SoxZ